MGNVRNIHYYDMVRAIEGGVWDRKEYRAKLIMSNSDNEFESNWNEFQKALEDRANWSELKTEWLETAEEMKQDLGDF